MTFHSIFIHVYLSNIIYCICSTVKRSIKLKNSLWRSFLLLLFVLLSFFLDSKSQWNFVIAQMFQNRKTLDAGLVLTELYNWEPFCPLPRLRRAAASWGQPYSFSLFPTFFRTFFYYFYIGHRSQDFLLSTSLLALSVAPSWWNELNALINTQFH